jgi:hypothetical protein
MRFFSNLILPVVAALSLLQCMAPAEFENVVDSLPGADKSDGAVSDVSDLSDQRPSDLSEMSEMSEMSDQEGRPSELSEMSEMSDLSEQRPSELSEMSDSSDACQPSCVGKACGDDGCGGFCGQCPENQTCSEGQCVCMVDECDVEAEKTCCDGLSYKQCTVTNGCGTWGECQACEGQYMGCKDLQDPICQCIPQCDLLGHQCGPDGCGGNCLDKCGELLGLFKCGGEENPNQCMPDCEKLCEGIACGTITAFKNWDADWTLKPDPAEACLCGTCEPKAGSPCEEVVGCDKKDGCTYTPNDDLCPDDEIACTIASCVKDQGCLVSLENNECPPESPCTLWACDPAQGGGDPKTGCYPTFTQNACDDGNLCTLNDTCSGGACNGDPVNCDDGQVCNGLEGCDAATGDCITSIPAPDIDDGLACTEDSCLETEELGATIVHMPQHEKCADTFDCTTDLCVEGVGCQHTAAPGFCKTNACSLEVACDPAKAPAGSGCVDVKILDCDDGNDCTNDGCDFQTGCFHKPVEDGVGCDDGDECTDGDGCAGGICIGTPKKCVDDNVCTTDSCDAATGICKFPATGDGGACDDGDPCTLGGKCQQGKCIPDANGADSDCKSDSDWDNDGTANALDLCPFSFDPAGNPDENGIPGPDACEKLSDHGTFSCNRSLHFDQGGGWSKYRRTSEPVELPLLNGYVDDSVLKLMRFDGDMVDSSPNGADGELWGQITFSDGAFAGGGKAVKCNGQEGDASLGQVNLTTRGTMCFWLKTTSTDYWSMGRRTQWNGTFELSLMPGAGPVEDTLSVKSCGDVGCNANRCVQTTLPVAIADGKWHNYCLAWDLAATGADSFHFIVDGTLSTSVPCGGAGAVTPPSLDLFSVCYLLWEDGSKGAAGNGLVDDFVIFDRMVLPDQIVAYYRSGQPFGTSFVSGAQADFDDVRVTETPASEEPGGVFVRPAQVLGKRVHSDSACPVGASAATFADRDDLCGVYGYWKLDGNGKDVLGAHDGAVANQFKTDAGFLGKADTAFYTVSDGNDLSIPNLAFQNMGDMSAGVTVEAWVMWDGGYENEGNQQGTIFEFSPFSTGSPPLRLLVHEGNLTCTAVDGNWGGYEVAMNGGMYPLVWYHAACRFLPKTFELALFVNGGKVASKKLGWGLYSPSGDHAFVGRGKLVGYGYKGRIDELLVHMVAKSDRYLYNRAQPGVPMLRFLANTAVAGYQSGVDKLFATHGYTLHYGCPAATMAVPFTGTGDAGGHDDPASYGILSKSLGYRGWWRFDVGDQSGFMDSSWTGKVLAVPGNTAQYWPTSTWGPEGMAVTFNDADDVLEVAYPYGEMFEAPPATFEALVLLGKLGKQSVARWGYSGTIYKWRLYFFGDNRVAIALNTAAHWLLGNATATVNQWTHIAGTVSAGNVLDAKAGYQGSGGSLTGSGGMGTFSGDEVLSVGNDKGEPSDYHFRGSIDSLRIMARQLPVDEFLHHPMLQYSYNASQCGQ